MILDDGFRLSGPNHHRVENLWPQYRDASHNRHHDDQRLSGPQRATGWLTVPAVGRCCHCGGWQQQQFLELPKLPKPMVFTLTFFPAFLSIPRRPWGRDAVCLPIASKCFSSKKLSVFTSMFAAWQTVERYRPHNRNRFDNFHSIFPFRAPLTEMTRLLLVGCFKCTQFNLSFRFTFLLQSRSSLRFGNQLLHNLRGMEKSY